MTKREYKLPDFDKLMTIGKVPAKKRGPLESFVKASLNEAWRAHKVDGKQIRTSDVLPYLEGLREALVVLQYGNRGFPAGNLVNASFGPKMSVDDVIAHVDHAAGLATKIFRHRGTPEGTQGRPGFDVLVHQLVIPIEYIGGKFLCYRAKGVDRADGNFAKFLAELDLPKNFVPTSGKAIVSAFKRAHDPTNK